MANLVCSRLLQLPGDLGEHVTSYVHLAPLDLRIRELLHKNILSELAACLGHFARRDLSTNQPFWNQRQGPCAHVGRKHHAHVFSDRIFILLTTG
jgi:hypothetical protein